MLCTRFEYSEGFQEWQLHREEDPSTYPNTWCLLVFEDGLHLAKWSKSNYCWIGTDLTKLDAPYDVEFVQIIDTGAEKLLDVAQPQ